MKKNLSYFMKKNREPEIVSVLGPESFVDENGARIMSYGSRGNASKGY